MGEDKYSFEDKVNYILGLASIVAAFFNPMIGIVSAIVCLVLTKKEKSEIAKKSKKLAKIGLVLSIITLIILIVLAGISILQQVNSGAFPNSPLG